MRTLQPIRINTVHSALSLAAAVLLATTLFFAGCGGSGGGNGGATSFRSVHDVGIFELDGNVADDSGAGLPDDWANVYTGPSGAFATHFVADHVGTAETSFFTGGGSKDGNLIAQWQWENTNDVIPDKDDIVHAFAAAYDYEVEPGVVHTILYFGADRFATDGSAEIGFWFFRRPVSLGTKPSFVGEHSIGDILVLANFVNGGKVGLIDVYRWVGGKNPLALLGSGGDCADAAAGDPVCAMINTASGEAPPWAYTNKDGQTAYQVGALFEGGIDLTALLGADCGCFSAFMAETRSSHSTSAQLKDFALGEFPVCKISVGKTGDALSKVGDPVDYAITIANEGRSTLYKQSINDTLLGNLTAAGTFAAYTSDCGTSLAPGATCTITYSYTVPSGAADPLENTVNISYNDAADFTGVPFAEASSHAVNLFQPSITLDKKAEGSDGPLTVDQGDTVDYAITLTNTSSADSPDLECTITDAMLGISETVTLAAGNDITAQGSETFLAAGDFTNTATASCSPVGFPNILPAEDAVTVTVLPAVVELTVDKSGPTYSKAGDDAVYTIVITNEHPENVVTLTSIADTLLGDLTDGTNAAITASDCPVAPATLAAGASCTIQAAYTVQSGDPDPLVNTVTVQGMDVYANTTTEPYPSDSHEVDLVHPGFTVAKTCLSEPVPIGSSVNFRIEIVNTGDVALLLDISDPGLGIALTDELLGERGGAACTEEDFLANNVGCLRLEGSVTAEITEVTNRVDVHATLPAEFGLSNFYDEYAEGTCSAGEGGATRTWGFWKTHGSDGDRFDPPVAYGYTGHVFASPDHLNGLVNLGWKEPLTYEEVFAIFWASPAKNGDGSKRDQLCKAKLHGSQQLLAAILNSGLDNGAPVPAGLITAMQTALQGTDRQAIISLAGQLAAYNESGDDVAIVDNDGALIPHADPRGTRSIMETAFADCP